ncbi:hypothetical protein TSAR_009018 [Trichomalopsis sarcophagae]|uniref:Uncharacterized protein n=1 Tax=Trichomalopsis sarcophagae TaxID=543379 RepID=A0A232FA89_9HYME|nr:hypothetical protein TSAR_009018 [Trichomalopsis sarcophagae]
MSGPSSKSSETILAWMAHHYIYTQDVDPYVGNRKVPMRHLLKEPMGLRDEERRRVYHNCYHNMDSITNQKEPNERWEKSSVEERVRYGPRCYGPLSSSVSRMWNMILCKAELCCGVFLGCLLQSVSTFGN